MADTYHAPAYFSHEFNCPHCHVRAEQVWRPLLYALTDQPVSQANSRLAQFYVSVCTYPPCGRIALWDSGSHRMLDPEPLEGPEPHPDLSPEIQADYREAQAILGRSPRGAAALLRLAIQKLVIQLGQKGTNLNHDIGELVKQGLPSEIQMALDAVRVVGGEAVHPGSMDLKDDTGTATQLLTLMNMIAQRMIQEPRELKVLYQALPSTKREQIERRDKSAPR